MNLKPTVISSCAAYVSHQNALSKYGYMEKSYETEFYWDLDKKFKHNKYKRAYKKR